MRKLILSILLGAFVMGGFVGCKYEDGPWFSLRSAERRMVNSWKFTFMQFNGANGLAGNGPGTINYNLSRLGFNDEGRFSATWQIVGAENELLTGNWSFEDDNKRLVLDYDLLPERRQVFDIVKLKNDELWLDERIGDDLFEYQLNGEE